MSDTNKDHNPFREQQETQVPESPHVNFSTRSPSILPTPVYHDDSSSLISSPVLPSPSVANNKPSPLNQQINQKEEEEEQNHDEIKLDEKKINETYGPTFQEDEHQYNASAAPVTSALLTSGFVPPTSPQQQQQPFSTDQDYHNEKIVTASSVPPPPIGQSRAGTFMNRLKGYQHPNDIEGGNTPPFQRFEEAPRRSLLYRQLFGGSRFASFTYLTAIAMIATFVYELIRNTQLTGSAIQTSPFNPMVGPNYMALVNMGSKFDPCMRSIPSYSASTSISNCYASTESTCTIEELCGFGGFQGGTPNQSFRFFTSIFLHAGIVHILMNLITHFSLGSDIERILGSIRYAILYLGSGVFGFVLSALLAGPTVSSMGCSGALFGIVGFTVVDLLFRWRETKRPGRELAQLLFVVVVSLVLGLLPGLDNFAHIGGLVMGLLLGTLLSSIRSTASARAKMITWICKVISLVLIVVLFIVVLQAFYQASDLSAVCPGCKYLSCLPVNGWCDV